MVTPTCVFSYPKDSFLTRFLYPSPPHCLRLYSGQRGPNAVMTSVALERGLIPLVRLSRGKVFLYGQGVGAEGLRLSLSWVLQTCRC